MPDHPHASDPDLQPKIITSSNSPNSPDRLPFYVPSNYSLASQPAPRPGWYMCQLKDRRLCYLYWPGDWVKVKYWVELPEFVRALLGPG